jgi:hypothetical protein
MSDTDTAAPTAHDQMMDMVFKGDAAGAQAMSAQVNREAGIEQPQVGHDPLALAPMPDAPRAEVGEVDRAVAILTEHGGEHAALVQEWKQSGANIGEELAYAKAAFRDIVANRPDLIAKVDASGLGNDPAVLKLLAQHGRLQAGMTGDFTVARNGSSPSEAPAFRGGGGSKAALLAELSQIRKDNPVGTEKYKNPAVQRRITQINETLYPGDIVGRGGRTA